MAESMQKLYITPISPDIEVKFSGIFRIEGPVDRRSEAGDALIWKPVAVFSLYENGKETGIRQFYYLENINKDIVERGIFDETNCIKGRGFFFANITVEMLENVKKELETAVKLSQPELIEKFAKHTTLTRQTVPVAATTPISPDAKIEFSGVFRIEKGLKPRKPTATFSVPIWQPMAAFSVYENGKKTGHTRFYYLDNSLDRDIASRHEFDKTGVMPQSVTDYKDKLFYFKNITVEMLEKAKARMQIASKLSQPRLIKFLNPYPLQPKRMATQQPTVRRITGKSTGQSVQQQIYVRPKSFFATMAR